MGRVQWLTVVGVSVASFIPSGAEAQKEGELFVQEESSHAVGTEVPVEAPIEPADTTAAAGGGEDEAARIDVNVGVQVEVRGEGNDEPEPEGHTGPGTHFLAEAGGGLTFGPGSSGDIGHHSHVLLGAGGRLNGGWLRFYALAGLVHTSVTSSGTRDGLQYDARQSHLDVVVGLRVYAPIFGPLRLFTDFLGGGTHARARLLGGPTGTQEARSWHGVAHWGFGLQVRIKRELSVGGRLGLRWSGDDLNALRGVAGLSDETRSLSLSMGVAWHF